MADWAKSGGKPYAHLKKITHPVLITNGNNDTMIPTVNSFTLSENLPNAQLNRMIPPDAQRAMSKRSGSTVVEVKGSHAVYVSQPQAVAALIEKAAKGAAGAVQ
jgi:pimeloyl-ACP methyl ester carboxylesterase